MSRNFTEIMLMYGGKRKELFFYMTNTNTFQKNREYFMNFQRRFS
jgi:hypothetical protein